MDVSCPSNTPAEFTQAGVVVDEEFMPGLLVYGVPVGTDSYVKEMLDSKITEI